VMWVIRACDQGTSVRELRGGRRRLREKSLFDTQPLKGRLNSKDCRYR
jgi:hypothetical protein